MEIYFGFIFFTLGAIMGSFLQVMISDYRDYYKKNELSEKSEFKFIWNDLLHGSAWKNFTTRRSACPKCKHTLSALELVPIVSFLIQRGKCTQCEARIPVSDFVIEILVGFLFLISYIVLGLGVSLFFWFLIWVFLILIFGFDLYEMEIPNLFLVPFVGLSFLFALVQIDWINHIAGGLITGGFLLFLWFITKGRGIGFADWKLALGIGWLLGIGSGITAIMLAFWVGAAIGIVLLVLQKINTGLVKFGTAIPFGPFLVIGLALTVLTGVDLFSPLF